jgi:2-haloalkanoic acid dehalogenase type II
MELDNQRWVTFDCYGTLIDWESGLMSTLHSLWPDVAAERLLEAYHRIEPRVQHDTAMPYRAVMAESLRRLAAAEGLPLAPGQDDALGEALPGWLPFPEVPTALAEVRRRGWRLGLLSNSDPDLLRASVRHLGVAIDVMVTVAEAGSYKPAAGHWLRFRELSNVRAGFHVHVAASLFHDIAPASALGIPAIWIDRETDVTNRIIGPREPGELIRFPDLTPLPEALEEIIPRRLRPV